MLRAALAVLLLSALPATARADDAAAPPAAKAEAPAKHRARKAAHLKPKAEAATPAAPADLLTGAPAAPKKDDAGPERPGTAWDIAPKWSASNGGSAAYGTRALINELGVNPNETTGYGAGAGVNFHF